MGRGRNGNGPAPMSSVLQSPKDTPLEFFKDPDRPSSARMSDRPVGAFTGLRPSSFTMIKGSPRSRVSTINEEGRKPFKANPVLAGPKYFSGGGVGDFGRSDSSVVDMSWRGSSRLKVFGSNRSREHSTTSNSSREKDNNPGDRGLHLSHRKGSFVERLFRDGSRHFSTRMSFEDDVTPGAFLEDQYNSVGTSLRPVDTSGGALFRSTRVADSSSRGHITTAAQKRRVQAGTSRATDGSGLSMRRSTNVLATNDGQDSESVALQATQENLRGAIEAGKALAVEALVRVMGEEEAEVQLVAQDRERGTPLMLAAAGKSEQTFKATMDAITSRLGIEVLVSELEAKDLRAWGPVMHASWSGSADVFRAVVAAIETHLGADQVAAHLASTAQHGWTPLHAAARGNADAMGAVLATLVKYLEADELKEELFQSHDKDSNLPTPLMFAAASSSLDSRSLGPLLEEMLGCVCDIDEARRQRTAVGYAAAYGRLDTLSCLITYGCDITDQTVTTLLAGDLAVGAPAFNKCIWKGITTARNPLIPAHNVLRAVGRAANRNAKHRQFLLRMQSDIDELVQELLQQLPPNMAGFAENHMDTGQGFAAVQWLLEPEMAGKRVPTFTGPLARALETRRLEFFSSNIVLDYVGRKFSSGLPGIFSGASWRMPDMHNRDTKRFVLGLPYGAAPDNVVGAVRMRLCVPFEFIQGSALRRTSLLPGLQFNCVGLASCPNAFYEVPAVRMAFDVVTYLSMLLLFCFVMKLESPSHVPAPEITFYAYMLGTIVNELGEARSLRKLRGQSEMWNVVEAILLALMCAAFTARMIALHSEALQEEAFFVAQLLFAIAAPLFFSRVLFLAQIDENLGLMVQILFRMLKEVVRFGVVIGVVLFGFAMSMFSLFGGTASTAGEDDSSSSSSSSRPQPVNSEDDAGNLGEPVRFLQTGDKLDATEYPSNYNISELYLPSFSTFSESALTLFRAMFGDFDFDEFAGIRYGPAGVGLMVAFLTIMVIVLLNLLIAFLSGAHSQMQKVAKAKIVQHWDRVVSHDVLPAPLNLVHGTICLPVKLIMSKPSYPGFQARIGCLLFWLVMGPLGAVLTMAMRLVSLPWSLWTILFVAQTGKEVDRKFERLKYVVSAPGLVLIALLLGFLSIFVGDGSSVGASRQPGQTPRSKRKDKLQRGGDYDLSGLLKKLANIGVDDLRRQLKNPLKDSQVLPRDAKMGATVEHVKQLRDDITTTTTQNMKDNLKDALKPMEYRMNSLEDKLSQVMRLLENAQTQRKTQWTQTGEPSDDAPIVSEPRSWDARAGSGVPGE